MGTDTGHAPLRLVRLRRVGARDLAVLHPALAAAYVRTVAAVAPAIETSLSDAVIANRVLAASVDPPVLRLRPFARERTAFRRGLRTLAEQRRWLLHTDVRACFPSIGPGSVGAELRALGCDAASTDEVVAMLERLHGLGVRGLPVGPDASAVVANVVLAPADRAIEASGHRHLRWVDDLVIAVRGPADAVRVLRRVRDALAEVGLRLNEAKTRLVPPSSPVDEAVVVSLRSGTRGPQRRVAT